MHSKFKSIKKYATKIISDFISNKDLKYMMSTNVDNCYNLMIKKYGKVDGDYFLKPTCKTVNKSILKSEHGLYCHHMLETEVKGLSIKKIAANNDYKYQKSENLCYCNALEHLIIHIKIDEEYRELGEYGYGTLSILESILRIINEKYIEEWAEKYKLNIVNDISDIVLICIYIMIINIAKHDSLTPIMASSFFYDTSFEFSNKRCSVAAYYPIHEIESAVLDLQKVCTNKEVYEILNEVKLNASVIPYGRLIKRK